jgi:hypothetical protein
MGLNLTPTTFAVPEPMSDLEDDSSDYIPRPVRRLTWLRVFAQAVLRILIAAVLAAAVVLLGVAGMSVTSAPRWVSLLVEPFGFLLAPGAMYAWGQAIYTRLDFSSDTVVRVSFIFYVLLFTLILLARLGSAVRASRTAQTRHRRSR